MKVRSAILILLSAVIGLLIGFIDSRPSWDDAGVTMGAIFVSAAIIGSLGRRRPWVWGLVIGCGVLPFGFGLTKLLVSVLTVCAGVAGSYGGAFLRNLLEQDFSKTKEG